MNSGNHQPPLPNHRSFATTRWNLVCAVGDHNDQTATTALQELCQIYWLSLDFKNADSRYQQEPAHQQTADLIYQKQWAKTLLERVRQELRSEYASRGKAHQFDRLEVFIAGKNSEDTLGSAAAELEMTQVTVKVAVHRMRQRFGELLRAEIQQTVASPEEVQSEIQQLFEVLRN